MGYYGSLREGEPLNGQTPRAARLFGTWAFLAGILRIYAAFRIEDGDMYRLAMWTYGIAAAHYGIEGLVFGTPDPGRKWALIVSVSTLAWMIAQAGFYVQTTGVRSITELPSRNIYSD